MQLSFAWHFFVTVLSSIPSWACLLPRQVPRGDIQWSGEAAETKETHSSLLHLDNSNLPTCPSNDVGANSTIIKKAGRGRGTHRFDIEESSSNTIPSIVNTEAVLRKGTFIPVQLQAVYP